MLSHWEKKKPKPTQKQKDKQESLYGKRRWLQSSPLKWEALPGDDGCVCDTVAELPSRSTIVLLICHLFNTLY